MIISLIPNIQSSIEQIESYYQQLNQPVLAVEQINTAESISARIYFKQLFGATFKRFEADTTNYALNYAYAIVRAMIMNILCIKGLHPALGVWHHSIRNRFNLADDLIEPIRPWLDKKVVALNPQTEFTKAEKQTILSVMYSQVTFHGNRYTLKHAISLYIDEFYNFMINDCDSISPINFDWDQ